MYKITLNDKLLALVKKPHYIRVNPNSGVYVESIPSEAEGIAVNSIPYNLEGFNISENGTVKIQEVEEYEYLLAKIASIEALENAICDLDETINGGE